MLKGLKMSLIMTCLSLSRPIFIALVELRGQGKVGIASHFCIKMRYLGLLIDSLFPNPSFFSWI